MDESGDWQICLCFCRMDRFGKGCVGNKNSENKNTQMKKISKNALARVEGGWSYPKRRIVSLLYNGLKYLVGKYLEQLDEISRDKGINPTPWYGPHGGGFK